MRVVNMKISGCGWEDFVAHGQIFPREITDDTSILYHGTSGENADSIERDGLEWRGGVYEYEDIVRVVAVYHALGWFGISGDGLPTLTSFTRNDFAGGASKPIYLAETAWRASRYARRDVAGGETARALRCAFDDLLLYVADRAIRDAHASEAPADVFPGAPSWPEVESVAVNAEKHGLSDDDRRLWVEEQLRRLVGLHDRCRVPLLRYTHGVVYAIRITHEDRGILRSRGGTGGVEWPGRIPPERLVGKAALPMNYEHRVDLFKDQDAERGRRRMAHGFWHSDVLKESDSKTIL
jgi:hypothetical protein